MLRVLTGCFLALWVMALTLRATPPPGYYANATNQSGAALRLALHRILTNAVVIPYSSTKLDTSDALMVLDEDPPVSLYRKGGQCWVRWHGWFS